MADFSTDRVTPARQAAEPLSELSRRDPGMARKRRPARSPRREQSPEDDLWDDDDTPPHQIDRLA